MRVILHLTQSHVPCGRAEFTIMNRPTTPRANAFGHLLMATALCLSFAAPAYAEGKADRARAAIAEAQTKIDTAESMGTSTAQPGRTAEANAALARAKENLAAGHKPEAIAEAIHASALADTALGQMQKNAAQHNEAMQVQAQDQANGMARAQMNVDAAHMQTDMANDRANRAENAAAVSASDAASSRNAAMAAQAQAQAQAQARANCGRAPLAWKTAGSKMWLVVSSTTRRDDIM